MHYISWHVLARRGKGCEESSGNWTGELNRETRHPIKCYKHSRTRRSPDKSPLESAPSWRRSRFDGTLITTQSSSVMSELLLREGCWCWWWWGWWWWNTCKTPTVYQSDSWSTECVCFVERQIFFFSLCKERSRLMNLTSAHGHLSVQLLSLSLSLFLSSWCVSRQAAGPGNLGTDWLGTTN